ncbi:uncharacterized protein METZ01_LOCUS364729, partial [marine metagenome]
MKSNTQRFSLLLIVTAAFLHAEDTK